VTLIKEAFVGLIGLFISLELYICDMAIHQRGMTYLHTQIRGIDQPLLVFWRMQKRDKGEKRV